MWDETPTLQLWGALVPPLSYQALVSQFEVQSKGIKLTVFSEFSVHTCSTSPLEWYMTKKDYSHM